MTGLEFGFRVSEVFFHECAKLGGGVVTIGFCSVSLET